MNLTSSRGLSVFIELELDVVAAMVNGTSSCGSPPRVNILDELPHRLMLAPSTVRQAGPCDPDELLSEAGSHSRP